MAIAETIIHDGLDNFYSHRTAPSERAEDFKPVQREELKLYDDPLLQEEFVTEHDGLKETSLSISGITCAACIWLLEREIKRLSGIESFVINHTTHKAHISWQPNTCLSHALIKARELGYKAKPFRQHEAKLEAQRELRLSVFRIAIAGIATMQNMMFSIPLYLGMYNDLDIHIIDLFRWVSMFMAAPVVLFSALPFYNAALRSLKSKSLGMDIPVSIAILVAYFASAYLTLTTTPTLESDVYFDSVSMFAFFLLLGRYLEMQTRHRYLNDDAELDQLLPETAIRVKGEKQESIVSHRIQEGDIILIKQSDIAPADGLIHEGSSNFDESALTGEYLPIAKQVGDPVSAGTSNIENTVLLAVTSIPKQSRITAIVRLINQAQATKPRTQTLTDNIASYFVGFVLLTAVLTGIYWQMHNPALVFVSVLSVLVVTCPCALSLATPTALTSATSRLRQLGFLLAKGHALDAMVSAHDVIFDKTGTLTEGKLALVGTETTAHLDEKEAIDIASALEKHSKHPIASAFISNPPAEASQVSSEIGYGIRGTVNGQEYFLGSHDYMTQKLNLTPPQSELDKHSDGPVIFLASKTETLAKFAFSDTLREEAKLCIDQLKALGLTVHLLSGDRASAVAKVAQKVGIELVQSEQSPEDKLAYVESLHQKNRRVVMIGDGINDLPVLAKADLSIAMGSASNLTKLNSDAVLLNNHLEVLAEAFHTAFKTRRIVKQNMFWALAYNVSLLPLAAAALVAPYFAALGMSLSSLVVVFNSLRLRRQK
jgi:P-type Cu2+ transporter